MMEIIEENSTEDYNKLIELLDSLEFKKEDIDFSNFRYTKILNGFLYTVVSRTHLSINYTIKISISDENTDEMCFAKFTSYKETLDFLQSEFKILINAINRKRKINNLL